MSPFSLSVQYYIYILKICSYTQYISPQFERKLYKTLIFVIIKFTVSIIFQIRVAFK